MRCLLVAALLLLWPATLHVRSSLASTDVKLQWARPRWYNPSIVEHGGKLFSSAKKTRFDYKKGKNWWINIVFMCRGNNSRDVHDMRCGEFDPWQGARHKECEWGDGVKNGGKLDTSGIGDVKVWRWPGKGVYAIFGRKPQRNATHKVCGDFVVYHQWISLIEPDPGLRAPDPWLLTAPLPLLPDAASAYQIYTPCMRFAMEKNWMPFVHKGADGVERLYVTYTVQPHVVFEVLPNGTSVHRWTTHDATLMAPFARYDVHGGPALAYVPGELSRSRQPYYLGIMHHIERFDDGLMASSVRLYRHFAFKVSPQPPFAITAISEELPLVFNNTYRGRMAYIAFVSGLDVNSQGLVYISYGSADIESRVLQLSLAELERLFTGKVAFRKIKIGLGLTGFGVLFALVGMIFFFDRGLIAMGNLLFLAGLATTIGFKSTVQFFLRKKNRKGSFFYLGGCAVVVYGWPVVGLLFEAYGFWLLFCEFFPTVLQFFRQVPFLGRILDLPVIKWFINRLAPMGGLPTTTFQAGVSKQRV